jgi:hypothetical protein
VAGRERRELFAPNVKKGISANYDCADMLLDEAREAGFKISFGPDVQDLELHTLDACCCLHIPHDALIIRIVRVHKHGKQTGLGNELGKQIELLGD